MHIAAEAERYLILVEFHLNAGKYFMHIAVVADRHFILFNLVSMLESILCILQLRQRGI